ncbi:unnamed protein product [Nezara viridula]|uniref:Uncharacterized protein n=1 Tax=Nezara viridula TaxID=85310 RepID=A0A9P0H2V9_NEZVI|nr:unnamed protein product [Nezara viridula]
MSSPRTSPSKEPDKVKVAFQRKSPPKLQELCEIVVQPLIGKEMDYIQLKNFSKAASLGK